MCFLDNEKKYSTLYSKMRKTTLVKKRYTNDTTEFPYKFISSHNSIREIKGHSKDVKKAIADAKVDLEPKPIRFLE